MVMGLVLWFTVSCDVFRKSMTSLQCDWSLTMLNLNQPVLLISSSTNTTISDHAHAYTPQHLYIYTICYVTVSSVVFQKLVISYSLLFTVQQTALNFIVSQTTLQYNLYIKSIMVHQ